MRQRGECLSSARETLRDALWRARGQRRSSGIWVTVETGPRVTTNTGWNFSIRSQATEEWENSGKFSCLFLSLGWGGGLAGSAGGSHSAPNKRSLPAPPRNHMEPDSRSLHFTLFSLFIARRIPPSIPPGLKPLLRVSVHSRIRFPSPAAGKSQIPRTPLLRRPIPASQ